MVLKNLCALLRWAKVASALEEFSSMDYYVNPLHLPHTSSLTIIMVILIIIIIVIIMILMLLLY